jgi:ribosomal protein S18 acetylase RimI-like enzyme
MNLEFQAVTNDLEPCLALMQAYYEFDGIEFDPTRARRALEQMIREDHGRAWMVELEGQTAGYVPVGYVIVLYGFSLEYGGRVLEIDELFIQTEFRGQGLGRTILEFVEAQARTFGAILLTLETESENEKAQSFYGKHGFTKLERQLMRKRL